ncbi:hypothetical protein C0Q70_11842 [Pomacea canaliculata]|uniref:Insulin-like domain-containing protein n=2 Tax=Pomacea canaliculata TaxID=400727 RepID=A0A2T7P735_POMCA|nr:hypothetical protein C0Q70_11842 [Pomacea canaliculata]
MAFTERFTRTTGESLYELWHSDCHRRCRSQLIGHVTLACQFDPYKVTRRTLSKRDVNSTIAHLISDIEQTNSPFLARSAAASFLNKQSGRLSSLHKIHKRGIMDECCYTKSCSWEEYAEFCHSHNRRPAYRDTQCYP